MMKKGAKMFVRRCIVTILSLLVVLVGILVACAVPAPTSAPTATATLTPTATPTGALAQIIAEAKKEGTVSVILRAGFTPKSIDRMKKEMKDMFGVDLDIKVTPSASFPKHLADIILEYKAGATPTYDLVTFSDASLLQANQAGVTEKVDWKPLLTQDSNPEVVPQQPACFGAITYYTGYIGLMYNPEKVAADAVPLDLSQLADPKWKGKVGIYNYPAVWVKWAFILGKEKVLADLRAILRNKAIVGTYQDEYNRYLLGEISMAFITTAYLKQGWDKGMPATYQSLDFADAREYCLVMPKGAAHSNGAKLLALYLASSAGAKFTLEEAGTGNLYYPGNYEHDITAQNKRQGIPERALATPGFLEFSLTDENVQWQSEIDLILKMGG